MLCLLPLQTLLNLSEEQVQDLMLLRRLFIVKRLLLSTQRARLTARMQEQSPDLISDALKASSIATQLGNNAAQDRQMFHRFTWGVYCGVGHVCVRTFDACHSVSCVLQGMHCLLSIASVTSAITPCHWCSCLLRVTPYVEQITSPCRFSALQSAHTLSDRPDPQACAK